MYRRLGFATWGLLLALAAIRLLGPSDLMDNEQQRQAAYVMDAVRDHHWIMQVDQDGVVASKPPMFTWLAALVMEAVRSVEPALRIAAWLSTAATAWLIQRLTRRYAGSRAAMWAVIAYLVALPGARQIWLGRMDAFFPLAVALGAWAAWLACEGKRSWVWFWLAGAVSTLTKGPLGILLSATGLGARIRQPKPAGIVRRRAGVGHLIGIGLFLAITVGWLLAARYSLGPALYAKLFGDELVGKALGGGRPYRPLHMLFDPLAEFISRDFPWSVVSIIGVLAIWPRRPRQSQPTRRGRFHRYVASWLVLGIVPFCLTPHQRADLLMPLYVPGAILAGIALAKWSRRFSRRKEDLLIAIVAVSGLLLLAVRYDIFFQRDPAVQDTLAVQKLAVNLRQSTGADFPLTHVDDPFALQVDLNTMRPYFHGPTWRTTGVYNVGLEMNFDYDAAVALLQSDDAVYLAVADKAQILSRLPATAKMYELASAPQQLTPLVILSNRPTFAPEERTAFGDGALLVRMNGLRLLHASAADFAFSGNGSVSFFNQDTQPIDIRMTNESASGTSTKSTTILPGDVWDWTIPVQRPPITPPPVPSSAPAR